MSLRLSGEKLKVTKLNNLHQNHEISETCYKHYPENRKLEPSDRAYAKEMLGLDANRKKLQQKLMKKTGKFISNRDLSNISQTNRNSSTRNDLDATIEMLRTEYHCTVDVCSDAEKNFAGFFIQDDDMRKVFQAYPEIIFLDATYKLLEIQTPLYILAAEDSDGSTEVCGVAILAVETKETIEWMIEAFKKRNPSWEKVKKVMADKDVNERDIIKTCLPQAALLICLFHTLRTFRRELTTDKVNISIGTRQVLLELVEAMAYSRTLGDYVKSKNLFLASASDEAKTYFLENWDNIREEWVMCDKFGVGNFLNNTNNRLECINSKLKDVVKLYSSLEELFQQLFVTLSNLRGAVDHKAIMCVQRRKLSHNSLPEHIRMYTEHLTPYATKHVLPQIDIAVSTNYIFYENGNDSYQVQTSNGIATLTATKCSCSFSLAMNLPCRHIFALRAIKSMPLFDATLCAERWTASYYRSTQRSFLQSRQPTPTTSTASIGITQLPSSQPLTHNRKYRVANEVTRKIADVTAFTCGEVFDHRLS